MKVLKWLRANGCPWDEHTCAQAALGGHLELLKWARKNGCPWDASTCEFASIRRHLELLKWATDEALAAFGAFRIWDPVNFNERENN